MIYGKLNKLSSQKIEKILNNLLSILHYVPFKKLILLDLMKVQEKNMLNMTTWKFQ